MNKKHTKGELHPTFVSVVRMFRTERNWPYEKARDAAIELFRAKNWYIPECIENLYQKS